MILKLKSILNCDWSHKLQLVFVQVFGLRLPRERVPGFADFVVRCHLHFLHTLFLAFSVSRILERAAIGTSIRLRMGRRAGPGAVAFVFLFFSFSFIGFAAYFFTVSFSVFGIWSRVFFTVGLTGT